MTIQRIGHSLCGQRADGPRHRVERGRLQVGRYRPAADQEYGREPRRRDAPPRHPHHSTVSFAVHVLEAPSGFRRTVGGYGARRGRLCCCATGGPAGPRPAGMILNMTVVKINAITVPPDSGDELARRFAARAGAVDNQDGFEGFELLQPTDDRTTWLVVTRWRDEESFEAWRTSPAFGHGHGQGAGTATAHRPRARAGVRRMAAARRSRWPSAASSGRSRSPAAHRAGSASGPALNCAAWPGRPGSCARSFA